jgi:hypothetical protein
LERSGSDPFPSAISASRCSSRCSTSLGRKSAYHEPSLVRRVEAAMAAHA